MGLLLGLPVAWAFLLLFHPTGEGNLVFPIISEQLGKWQTVHIGMVLFIPMFAYAVRTMVAGLDNVAARTAWALLPVGAVLYGVYEAMVGIGTGALVAEVDGLSGTTTPSVRRWSRTSAQPVFRVFEYSGRWPAGGGRGGHRPAPRPVIGRTGSGSSCSRPARGHARPALRTGGPHPVRRRVLVGRRQLLAPTTVVAPGGVTPRRTRRRHPQRLVGAGTPAYTAVCMRTSTPPWCSRC